MMLVYIVDEYPPVTQTFVYREVDALRKSGAAVAVFPLRRGSVAVRPPHVWATATSRRELVSAALPFLFAHPYRCAKAVLAALRPIWPRLVARQFYAMLRAAELERHLQIHGNGIAAVHLHAHFAARCADVARHSLTICGKSRTYSVTVHAADIYDPDDFRLLCCRLSGASAVVAISKHAAAHVKEVCKIPSALVNVIHCGVDPGVLEDSAVSCLARDDAIMPKSERRRVVTVARFVEKKGWPLVVEACRWLKARGWSFEWVCIGDGPLAGDMREAAANADVSEVMRFVGCLCNDETLALLRSASACVLPCQVSTSGDMDGIPVSLMEAMSLGVPVVTTAAGAVTELVLNDVNGLVVGGTGQDIGLALERLWNNECLRARLVSAGKHTIECEFSSAIEAERLRRLFQAIA